MAHRYFTADIEGEAARLTGQDAAHLARVLRVKPGEMLCLCDGQGSDYTAQVLSASADCVDCRILEKTQSQSEAALKAGVFVAFGKGDKMDWAVQKAVELGAAAIYPFLSERCVARPKTDKSERLQRIANEAAGQSGRGILPPVAPLMEFDEVLKAAGEGYGRVLLFHPEGGADLAEGVRGAESLALITGPEGGFAPEEVQKARVAGVHITSLGPRILRCETAPIAALAAAMALAGEF